MKRVLTLDEHNYTESMPVYERFNVRAVIYDEGLLAMEHSRAGDYKFPGGGVDPGECLESALCREVREEMGMLVLPDSIRPLGEILEKRLDLFDKNKVYLCHTYFFACAVSEERIELELTDSERSAGYSPEWARPDWILKENQSFLSKKWIARDTKFLELWMNGAFSEPALED